MSLRRPRRLLLLGAALPLCCWTPAWAGSAAPPVAPQTGPAKKTVAAPAKGTRLSAEDREVVANLELLQLLEMLKDMELLENTEARP